MGSCKTSALVLLLAASLPAQGSGRCSSYGKGCGPTLGGSSVSLGALRRVEFDYRGGAPNAAGAHMFGLSAIDVTIPGTSCSLLTPPIAFLFFMTDANGDAKSKVDLPNSNLLQFYVQAFDTSLKTSNGLRFDPRNSVTRSVDLGRDVVTEGILGGSGMLGAFDVTHGKYLGKIGGKDTYEWNTDSMKIPLSATLNGVEYWRKKLNDPKATHLVIKDANFEFLDFVLQQTQRLRFVGSQIPRIKVVRDATIDGEIELAVPGAPSAPPNGLKGRPGHLGALGGASGGEGGHSPHYATNARVDGAPGGDIQLAMGHPRAASRVGTGGLGSRANPSKQPTTQAEYTNLIEWIAPNTPFASRQTSAGGGGGSYWSPVPGVYVGKDGTTAINIGFQSYLLSQLQQSKRAFGPDSKAGVPFPVWFTSSELANQYAKYKSADLFVNGGTGGGGAGADLMFANHLSWAQMQARPFDLLWSPGGGGGAGGGAIALQIAGTVTLGATGRISVRGGDGDGYDWTYLAGKGYSAGGGGSGGSVLIQTAQTPKLNGEIDVRGGNGGIASEKSIFLSTKSIGGDGGAGYIRVEAPTTPNYSLFPKFQPPAQIQNVGLLRPVDHDKVTAATSAWQDTGVLFRPLFLYYELQVRIGNRLVLFSDRDRFTQRAEDGQPVVILFQSAPIDSLTRQPTGGATRWVEGEIAPLDDEEDVGNGFRFMIRFDRTKTPGGDDKIVVDSLRVFFGC